jgi:hypothetical protein
VKTRWYESDAARSLGVIVPLALAVLAWRGGALPPAAAQLVADAADDGPNEVGLSELTLNYYEALQNVDREAPLRSNVGAMLVDWIGGKKELPPDWNATQEPMRILDDGGFQVKELIAGADVIYKQVRVRINRWGQRDRDYEKIKPPRTFRICLVGESNTMGYGVEQDQMYSELLEERLNRELAGRGAYDRYEVINFAQNGCHLPDRLYFTVTRFPEFQADLALAVGLSSDTRTFSHVSIARRVFEKRDLYFDFLKDVAGRAGVKPGLTEAQLQQRFKPYKEVLVEGCYKEFARFARRTGIPVAIVLLRLETEGVRSDLLWQGKVAEKCGLTVLRIFDAFEGRGPEMYLQDRDFHASPPAHRLIADEIFEKMMRDPGLKARLEGSAGVPPAAVPSQGDRNG